MSEHYKLMVSYDCGATYRPDKAASELPELQGRMDELDEQMHRWCIEKDGVQMLDPVCAIHQGIVDAMGLHRGMLDAMAFRQRGLEKVEGETDANQA